jgi:hypothetical protein
MPTPKQELFVRNIDVEQLEKDLIPEQPRRESRHSDPDPDKSTTEPRG